MPFGHAGFRLAKLRFRDSLSPVFSSVLPPKGGERAGGRESGHPGCGV